MTQLASTPLHSKPPFPNGFLIRRSRVRFSAGVPFVEFVDSQAKSEKAGNERTPVAFWKKVRCSNIEECWPWLATKDKDGYGRFHEGEHHIRAHRRAYELTKGVKLSDSQKVLHSCDNPPCCNPAHLSVGTHAQNMADRNAKGRSASGERNGRAKLTWETVRAIRAARIPFKFSIPKVAAKFGVNKYIVADIVNGRTWKEARP